MPRLIWVFAGRTCNCVGFVVMRLNSGMFSINSCQLKMKPDMGFEPLRMWHIVTSTPLLIHNNWFKSFTGSVCQHRKNRHSVTSGHKNTYACHAFIYTLVLQNKLHVQSKLIERLSVKICSSWDYEPCHTIFSYVNLKIQLRACAGKVNLNYFVFFLVTIL